MLQDDIIDKKHKFSTSKEKMSKKEHKNSDKFVNTINLPKSPKSSGIDLTSLKKTKNVEEDDINLPEDDVSEDELKDNSDTSSISSFGQEKYSIENKIKEEDILFPTLTSGRKISDSKIKEEKKKEKEKKEYELSLERKWKCGLSRFEPNSKLQKFLEKNNYQLDTQLCYTINDKKVLCMLKLISPLGDYFFAYLTCKNDTKFHDSDVLLENATQKNSINSSFKNGVLSRLPKSCMGIVFFSDSLYNIILSKDLSEKNLVIKNFKGDLSEEYTYPYPLVDIKEITNDPMSIARDVSHFSNNISKTLQELHKNNMEEVNEVIDELKESFIEFHEKEEESFEKIEHSKEKLKEILEEAFETHKKENRPLEELNFGPLIYNISQRSEMAIRLSRNLEMIADVSMNITQVRNSLMKLTEYLENEYHDFDKSFQPIED